MKAKLFAAISDAISRHPKGKPLDEAGRLVPDPTPMAPPIGFKPTPTISEMIRQQIRAASLEAAAHGLETEEEADDFDVGDDYTPESPYELDEESEVPIRVLKHRADQAQLDYLTAKREAGLRMQQDGSGKPSSPTQPPEASEGGSGGGSQKTPPRDPPGSPDPV